MPDHIEVFAIPDPALIWLRNVAIDPDDAQAFVETLVERVGHNRFVVLHTEGGEVAVYGSEDELLEAVRTAAERVITRPALDVVIEEATQVPTVDREVHH